MSKTFQKPIFGLLNGRIHIPQKYVKGTLLNQRLSDLICTPKRRWISYLRATYSRIYRGQSVLIEGDFRAGKTRFLKLLSPKKLHAIWVESLFNIHKSLASILRQLSCDTPATYRRTPQYLKIICGLSNCFIIIDEASDLDTRVWPYLKRIMDTGVPVLFAGLPKVRTYLNHNHPDILNRLNTLILYPIIVEDFTLEYKDFQQETIEQVYMAVKEDMRNFQEICKDCRDRAKELKYEFVDINLAIHRQMV